MQQTKLWRFLEIMPGAITWIALLAPIILSFFWPAAVATFVLVFDLYWLYKSVLMGYHLISGYKMLKKNIVIDWLNKCKAVQPDELVMDWKNVYQAVIFTTYKEEIDTLLPSFQAIIDSDFPNNRIILVLATEKRDYERAQKNAEILKQKFGRRFSAFLVTVHPDIVGEVKAKGANARFAAKVLQKYCDSKKIPYENMVVTTCDADTRIHKKYLSALTYQYIINPNRTRRSFQPIPLYSNNIWQVPAISRIISFSNSFWQLIEATRPWRLINFSTHAMSLKTLVEMEYWDVSVVNEDSRQFWRAYFKFDGDHEVVPIFIPVYMDAVLADSYWQTLKNQYLQKRRWYYGVEHFPYVVINSVTNKKIPFTDRFIKLYRLFEANYSLATSSFYIAVIAWLPLLFGPGFSGTVLAQNLPIIIRVLLGLTWIGLIASMIISTLLLPPRPVGFRKRKYLEVIAQWVFVPITAIFFSSLPAIDAQTRLMLGKYMTFHVTKKSTA
ncbi:MAG: hypothetical protein US94_C0005G0004 [Berkelbacteria bacterium GW2011_GWB1_38_5]|uniref:Glycosyltransferase 2-like domain-containing protein n=1 Tax=Berkelbacteria bacterium GW2011_GWB1_38_5 TaxID=1618336 RepID=A0A0G0K3V6_9BACT|nr:MAG: hypothetical protein US94_C0005G0004 [Berkelbacteria bacterium GW2011_GWB1_38_5]